MKICKCGRNYSGKFKLCGHCRARNRDYAKRARAKREGMKQPRHKEYTTICKHDEWFNYGNSVFVCADCGKIHRGTLEKGTVAV